MINLKMTETYTVGCILDLFWMHSEVVQLLDEKFSGCDYHLFIKLVI